jgi:hypothetical protein
MAFDSARDRMVFYYNAVWEWDPANSSWTSKQLTSQPSAFISPALVYDSLRGKVVLYGGRDMAGACTDTWEWDGAAGSWAKKMSNVVPPAGDSTMAFDPVRARMVMVTSAYETPITTWEWDGANWSQQILAGGGTPANLGQLQWDSTHKRIIGIAETAEGPQVWQWNPSGRTWTRLSFGCTPSARGAVALYFPRKDQLLYFGGSEWPTVYQELWAWAPDGSSWRKYQQTSPWPGPNIAPALAYDSKRQQLVLFGGNSGNQFQTELWTLSISP